MSLGILATAKQRCITKLRIKGNSLRLRLTRSEVSSVIGAGRVQETIHFSPIDETCLTYTLTCDSTVTSPQIQYTGREIVVVLPRGQATAWAGSDQVGIYSTVDLGLRGTLDLVVEKDFACLDLSDADNIDSFPNPNANTVF
jgi:hypothetical protein